MRKTKKNGSRKEILVVGRYGPFSLLVMSAWHWSAHRHNTVHVIMLLKAAPRRTLDLAHYVRALSTRALAASRSPRSAIAGRSIQLRNQHRRVHRSNLPH